MDAVVNWIPQVGMEFSSEDEVWRFWLEYGGRMGFNVRKQYANKNKKGEVTSRRFSCAKEGYREIANEVTLDKRFRAETRTGCKARIGFMLSKETGKYEIHDFVSEHNHPLHLPETSHLLSSQRKISEAQAVEIELADNSGIKPKAAHEFIGSYVGGSANLGYTHRDHKNHLQRRRQRNLMYGEAGSLLRYFHMQTVENPSFQYSIQLDSEEQITNIFWADAKMLIDYALFGEVVVFDTTFGTNKEHRPLGVFVGFNHFREVVIFGAALLYDETTESFRWLFETFLATHDKKQPKTIFTDQDIAMGNAVDEILRLVYDYDKEDEFEEAFNALREKVTKVSWLNSIYALKKKWAQCYMINIFSLGMRSTQLCESLNRDLKDYLHSNMDIMRFFNHFERVVRQKRQNEIKSEFDSREKLPRMKMKRTPLLRQVGQLYTPKVFESFQDEYDWSTAAYIKPPVEGQSSNEYIVAISNLDDNRVDDLEYKVLGDPFTQTVSCSCNMFDRVGLLCAHALKVLDAMNIKLVPEKYILKRWTKEARSGTLRDISGRIVVEDPQLDTTRRYRDLCRQFVNIASRAANFERSSSFLDSKLKVVIHEVEEMLSSIQIEEETITSSIPDLNVSVNQESVSIPHNVVLKKKDGRKRGKRYKSFIEKFHKKKENKKCATHVSKAKSSLLNQRLENQTQQQMEEQCSGSPSMISTFDHTQEINLTSQNVNADFTIHSPRVFFQNTSAQNVNTDFTIRNPQMFLHNTSAQGYDD